MAHTVFIDGAAGTTGLEITERLKDRSEFDIIRLNDEERRDTDCRKTALNYADFAILCLPDDAAREAVALIDEGSGTRVIDASSAHRTASNWTYGFPELVGPSVIAGAQRVSNPGCYPTGFLALIAPLVRAKLLPRDWPYTVNAVSGYSGGGKSLIERFEGEGNDIAFRAYGMDLGHKHLAEMQKKSGLANPPVFAPAVVPGFRGMVVEVPLAISAMRSASTPAKLRDELVRYYAESPVVTAHETVPPEILLRKDAQPTDRLDLYVASDEAGDTARLIAVLDNLGKGASGAAVQSLNLMADTDPVAGLRL
ncbi:N-acetyl-gamma-glutamyl-phosphate reductase [Aurantiacibacter gangjinensis]|uniref:N-acetyl-gamma-glutamyl-phosphate reductase n=1 Tax=Aurantiacibacter gangjinensis TaxID=502682 RepID=A0A0G9MW12_9SPHN|nr:N-acetyl-gamma-glutamyl-phosphate reductase [Aurantiacibacter gangjinensis]APE27033.1 N-acetyl-gamma-glutamyl-phosphate reductase [Aurantiacibacter gangjinensis]KLE33468.1 N-acetyl-gamma-glutamyl-phosphate reductase [Aurantiacibacter gangjinensis]